MVQYVIEISRTIIESLSGTNRHPAVDLLPELVTELGRLDPRDFLPDSRAAFVTVRAELGPFRERVLASDHRLAHLVPAVIRVIDVLGTYGGDGSRAITRSFAFVRDAGLSQIVERDYRELRQNVFPGGSWKSTVILAGSILEAILHDQLTADPAVKAKAEAAAAAPKYRTGTVKDIDAGDWHLTDLIKVAVELRILPAPRADSIDQVLRDYRNFVHPLKELRSKHACDEAEAMMAVGALDGVCNELERRAA